MDGEALEEVAERYWPQVEAYAVGLNQGDSNRQVMSTLYFTEAGESRTRRYEVAELEGLDTVMQSRVACLHSSDESTE